MKWFIILVAFFIAGNVQGQGQDVSCTGQPEYYENGNLEFCTLSSENILYGQPLPAGTGVHFTEDGVFNWCFLQQDTKIQGHLLEARVITL